MSKLFLVGMPGAGKTYWGKKIGEAYQMPFFDMDNYIERATQQTITEIFAKEGENYFRELETETLKSIIAHDGDMVVACGGGTPVFNGNMDLMRKHGCTVYLQTNTETLISRLSDEKDDRPLLKDKALEDMLQFMLSQRQEVYEQALYILPTEELSITNFAEIISTCIKGQ